MVSEILSLTKLNLNFGFYKELLIFLTISCIFCHALSLIISGKPFNKPKVMSSNFSFCIYWLFTSKWCSLFHKLTKKSLLHPWWMLWHWNVTFISPLFLSIVSTHLNYYHTVSISVSHVTCNKLMIPIKYNYLLLIVCNP